MARVRFVETLRLLVRNKVEFIVVGMGAGVLQGVPLTTLDLDILHRRTPENVDRLLSVLRELQATYASLAATGAEDASAVRGGAARVDLLQLLAAATVASINAMAPVAWQKKAAIPSLMATERSTVANERHYGQAPRLLRVK
jgi:hypothetical protein